MKSLLSFCLAFLLLPSVPAQYQPKDVLFSINKQAITAEEFERTYNKNLNVSSAEKQGVKEYFDLFLKFKLKVAAALDAGLDTLSSYKNELKGYRDQLASTYLTDNHVVDSLVQEAYNHTINDVNVSHILILFPENPVAADTLAAYKKIFEAYSKIKAGEPFEKIAEEYSQDPSVKMNKGNLGYITAFRFPYLFESCSYNTKVGEISKPLRTRYGYHLVKVNGRRNSPGEVRVAHLMVGVPQDGNDSAWDAAQKKIQAYYGQIKNGADFDTLAKKYSDDHNSAEVGGELPWFGTGRMVPEFETAAFSLKAPGEVSEPVKTAFGWHLIKLKEKRPLPSFDLLKSDLRTKVMNDERSEIIRNCFVNKLKKRYKYNTQSENISAFLGLDSSFYKGEVKVDGASLALPVLTIQSTIFTGEDFKKFLVENPVPSAKIPIKEYVGQAFDRFVDLSLLHYEDQQLESNNMDFRNLIEEYHDGILLFDIMDRKVWSFAVQDSTGLAKFYEGMPNKPTWGERVDATIFVCKDKIVAEKVKKALSKTKDKARVNEQISKMVCDSVAGMDCVMVDYKLFSKGDNKIIDSITWKPGLTSPIRSDEKILLVQVWEVRKPEVKSIDEVRGIITADYQNYLEEKWIADLKNKYNIVINQDLLHKIANKYNP